MSEDRGEWTFDRLRSLVADLRGAAAGRRAELDVIAEGLDALATEVDRSLREAKAQTSTALEELKMAQRRAKVGTWDFDLESQRGSWSAYMYELFDRDPQLGEPEYSDFLELIHPDDRERLSDAQQRALTGATGRAFEIRTNPQRITARILSCVIEVVARKDGSPWLQGTNVDVTEHRRVSVALADANDRLTQLLDNAPYTVLTVRPDGMISYINRPLSGWPAQVSGVPLPALMHPEDRPRLEAALRELFCDGSAFAVEAIDVAGSWIEARATALRSGDEVQNALVFMVDVTERRMAVDQHRRLEEQMQQAQRLESLGVLAGGIAHDFNNLLTTILGNASLAHDLVPADSPARECLQPIVTASRRAADLCNQMLAYSGKGRFVVEAIDVADLVRDMAHLLESSKSKRATLRLQFQPVDLVINGDASQLRQVLMNLIVNASDAILASGTITVSAGRRDCSADYLAESYLDDAIDPGPFVWVEVSDDGTGMDEDTQRKMFEPFFSSKGTGRGLGLAAVLGIVRSHGGAIRVRSQPRRGTTIRCLFPASSAAPAPKPGSRIGAPPSRSATILVVDDEQGVRRVLTSLLEHAGFEVLTAADGVDGVQRFREHRGRVSLVLLDATMPRMDGRGALREIRRIDPSARILLMSGYNEHSITQQYAAQGFVGFLKKPFAPADLIARIGEILGEDRRER